MTRESQNKQIYEYLKQGHSITPLKALELFGCFRLGARIFDIKNRFNAEIETEMVELNGKRFASYSLNKKQ